VPPLAALSLFFSPFPYYISIERCADIKRAVEDFMIKTNPIRTHSAGLDRIAADAVPSCIDKDDILSFNLERDRRLQCKNGLLWVTVQDDKTDYLLGDKVDMRIPRKRKVIVEAEEPSCFQID
jgi:hypothetical protein